MRGACIGRALTGRPGSSRLELQHTQQPMLKMQRTLQLQAAVTVHNTAHVLLDQRGPTVLQTAHEAFKRQETFPGMGN